MFEVEKPIQREPGSGPDDQTALLNSQAPSGEQVEDTRGAAEKYLEMQAQMLARIGATTGFDDLKPENPALLAALGKIAAAGAPAPTLVREIVISPTGSWPVDVYVFAKFQYPSITLRSSEQRLAADPDTVIRELKVAGIIK